MMSLPSLSQAEQFCFLLADNYYEQLYCEVKAKGKGRALPPFYEFKKNAPLTQALLLKRPAAKIGIEVSMPKKVTRSGKTVKANQWDPTATQQALTVKTTNQTAKRSKAVSRAHPLAACEVRSAIIACETEKFQLTGNKSNQYLVAGVLSHGNKLAIEPYKPQQHHGDQLHAYLINAYRQYIEKMLEIGLGASTLSYPKFVYLFNDMKLNDVDFSNRFETMFGFLKQDKLNISVSESVANVEKILLTDCMSINFEVIACPSGSKNYLFIKKPAGVKKG